jgi:hypothetical protein
MLLKTTYELSDGYKENEVFFSSKCNKIGFFLSYSCHGTQTHLN